MTHSAMSELVRTLKDGYWDLTTVVRSPDVTLRVRKGSKPTESPGRWSPASLRNDIAYL